MFFLPYAFLFLLLITFFIYYTAENKIKPYVLFISSLVFIAGFSVRAALFSLAFTVLNYFFGIMLEKGNANEKIKTRLFWLAIAADIGFLAFFKYINILSHDINSLFQLTNIQSPIVTIIKPLGISYYTFQALGYLIRIDRGSEKAERDFGAFATYLLFFPRFLSGPVERSNQFLPQMKAPPAFKSENLQQGLRLFLWGLFKKIVIANNLYQPVAGVYQHVHDFSGISLIVVLFVQTLYIYCDFSGYTDMALGTAKIFGINLMDNFNRPFLARNISEFWRRWHISLSSWCNDFIYNPFIVKFRRLGNTAVISGIFITFFIVGIWHGANLTFVILGILQGTAIVYEFFTKKYRLKFAKKFPKSIVNTVSRLIVFLFMSLSMVFFFSNTVSDAAYFISHLFSGTDTHWQTGTFISNLPVFLFALFCFLMLFIIEIFNEKGKNLLSAFLKQPLLIQWAGYITCILLIFFFRSEIEGFYYMRF